MLGPGGHLRGKRARFKVFISHGPRIIKGPKPSLGAKVGEWFHGDCTAGMALDPSVLVLGLWG